MEYYIPETLDIDQYIKEIPSNVINPFKKAKLLYIIDLITTIPANNKGLKLMNGYVPINAQFLQKKVRNYKQYLDYLVATNVFEVSKQYIPGERSRGYKFSKQYTTPVQIVTVGRPKEIRKMNGRNKSHLSASNQRKYQHLTKWYDEGLQIDKELAQQFILQDYQCKMSNKSLLDEADKDPLIQYNSALVSIEKIAAAALQFNIDDFGNRFHSTLTNLKSDLRNLLTYNGLKLVSIDIKNSQPYISTILLDTRFWELTTQLDVLTHKSIGIALTNIFNQYSTDYFIMLCKKAKSCKESDLHKYREIVQNGIFYEYMAAHSNMDATNRKKLKAAMFQVLFTGNSFINQKEAAPKLVFKELFPDVYELFNLLKRKEKANMPKLLQRIESYVILLVVTKRIAIEKPDLPIFTIHDSIVTVDGFEDYVKGIMEQEMEKIFGFPPQLMISNWKPENLSLGSSLACIPMQRAA